MILLAVNEDTDHTAQVHRSGHLLSTYVKRAIFLKLWLVFLIPYQPTILLREAFSVRRISECNKKKGLCVNASPNYNALIGKLYCHLQVIFVLVFYAGSIVLLLLLPINRISVILGSW